MNKCVVYRIDILVSKAINLEWAIMGFKIWIGTMIVNVFELENWNINSDEVIVRPETHLNLFGCICLKHWCLSIKGYFNAVHT